jgi:Uma2 family endonuclease
MDTTRQPPDALGEVKSMSDMAVQIEVPDRPITVEEFDQMVELGIIKPDERIELVEGHLVPLEPMNAPHASLAARLNHVLQPLSGRALLWPQLPLVISDRSKPLPDMGLLHRRGDFYREHLPDPEDVFAVIEVSDTTLKFDRGTKLVAYARAGIPEYWIVDVNEKTIEICRDPHDLGYGSRKSAGKGDSVSFAAFPDVVFSVDELLG